MDPQNPQQPIQSFTPQVEQSVPTSKSSLWWKVLLGVVLIVVIGGVGYFLGTKNSKPAQVTTTQYPTTAPSPIPTIDPTINWKTILSKYGYSIKISPGYKAGSVGFENIDPEGALGISIAQEKEEYNQPQIHIVGDASETRFKGKFNTAQELLQLGYNEYLSNTITFVKTVESIHESTFAGKKALFTKTAFSPTGRRGAEYQKVEYFLLL